MIDFLVLFVMYFSCGWLLQKYFKKTKELEERVSWLWDEVTEIQILLESQEKK